MKHGLICKSLFRIDTSSPCAIENKSKQNESHDSGMNSENTNRGDTSEAFLRLERTPGRTWAADGMV